MTRSFSTSFPLDKQDLKNFLDKEILVGPNETEEEFCKRIHIHQLLCKLFPSEASYPIVYSNRSLKIWEGAAVWHGPACRILPKFLNDFPNELKDEEISLIQIKKNFKKGKFLRYSLEEVLSHEKIHLMRATFNETKFEEILAYQTSSSSFRRYFGSFFLHGWEPYIFMMLVFAGSVFPVLFAVWFLFFAYIALRLVYLHKVFHRCSENLRRLLGRDNGDHMIRSLTDKEIFLFSKQNDEEILKYGKKENSLRWKQLKAVYSIFL